MDKNRVFYYGWFLLVSSLIIATMGYSIRYSFPLFYAEILREFGKTRAETAMAFSISILVYGISSPVIGTMTDRFGPRKVLVTGAFILVAGLLVVSQMQSLWPLYVFFGVVSSVGVNSLGYAVHTVYLTNWFVTRRGLAFGVISASAGAAMLVGALYSGLIVGLGWRMAYVVLAAMAFIIIVPLAILVIRRTPQEKGLLPDGALAEQRAVATRKAESLVLDREWASTDWTLARAMKRRQFWFLLLNNVGSGITLNLVLAHQPIHTQDIGFSSIIAASVYGIVGATIIAGNLSGFISDRLGREASYALGAVACIIGVAALILASVSQPWLLYVFAVIFGWGYGMAMPSYFSAAADLFGGKHFGAINGMSIVGFGIGGFLGPWVGGLIFDTVQDYTLAFIVAGLGISMGSLSIWLAAPRKVRLVPGKVSRAPLKPASLARE
ncbi:MAG: MFS transporter [Chloroflexi bacterium]|nr:MFS transporter [Chloroflexota bacterium]